MKKSDFTQKLLDDLRLRKQRLAAANGASNSDTRASNFHRPFQGSRAPNIHEIQNARQSRSHGRQKPLVGEASKELVPIHGPHSSEYITDLSMALAFALENGGRLGKIEFSTTPMAGKKNKPPAIHSRTQSIDFAGTTSITFFSDKSKAGPVRFPHLSQLHIQEISKGAQKLNQILKACSNGLSFDRYSIEIGKELLQGAIDLEESLRMLVNLQEVSERVVAPRRKQIQLLDGEEDEDEDAIVAGKQLSLQRPRFSLDGSSRNHLKEIAKISVVKNKLQALSYPETANSRQQNSQKQSSGISTHSHRRSATFDLDSRAIFTFSGSSKDVRTDKIASPLNSGTVSSNVSNHDTRSKSTIKPPKSLSSEQEKGRIPNVIAKLMGLEELPLEADKKSDGMKKAAESKQGAQEISKQKAQRSVKEENSLARSSEKTIPQINQQMKVLRANKIMLPPAVASESVVGVEKQDRRDLRYLENVNPLKPNFDVNRKINMVQADQIKENKIMEQEEQARAEKARPKEENTSGRGDLTLIGAPKPILQFYPQQRMSRLRDDPEAKVVEAAKRSAFLKEQKIVKEKASMHSNQHKPLHDGESKQQPSVQKPEPKDAKQGGVEREKITKVKLRIKDARCDMEVKNSLKLLHQSNVKKKLLQKNIISSAARKKGLTETVHRVQLKGHGSSTSSDSNIGESANGRMEEQRPTGSKANVERAAQLNPPVVLLKPVRNQSIQKMDNKLVVQKTEKARPIEEERDTKVEIPQTATRPWKQQTPVLQELKQAWNQKINETSEATGSIQPGIPNQHKKQKASPPSPSLNPVADDGIKAQKRENTLPENTNSHALASKAFASMPLPEIPSGEDQELKTNSKEILPKALTEGNTLDNCNSPQQKQQSIPKSEIQDGSLDIYENHLKQILIRSQHFLNAAEAFFNLEIPADILQASYHTCLDKDNKLVIDCAYEIMKRKGRREELPFHSPVKISIILVKVKSFDDLIRRLNEDIGYLSFHGREEDCDFDAANFLDNMLKRDIQSKNLDANCMWDIGWSDPTCAYLETDEVIKDVEKHVLNRLIDEIARDLINVDIAKFTASEL